MCTCFICSYPIRTSLRLHYRPIASIQPTSPFLAQHTSAPVPLWHVNILCFHSLLWESILVGAPSHLILFFSSFIINFILPSPSSSPPPSSLPHTSIMSKFIKSTLALVTLALVAMVALTTVKADATDETREAYGTVIGIGKSTLLSPPVGRSSPCCRIMVYQENKSRSTPRSKGSTHPTITFFFFKENHSDKNNRDLDAITYTSNDPEEESSGEISRSKNKKCPCTFRLDIRKGPQ